MSRNVLRFVGVRWPGAEGPGLALEIGRLARAVISEELLPYHLNLFGGTGRGKEYADAEHHSVDSRARGNVCGA